eukprot:4833466-Alexandrium_andersonii.AAC.1
MVVSAGWPEWPGPPATSFLRENLRTMRPRRRGNDKDHFKGFAKHCPYLPLPSGSHFRLLVAGSQQPVAHPLWPLL